MTNDGRVHLDLRTATGGWAVRSVEQPHTYFIDADAFALGRVAVPGGRPSPFDTLWLLILSIVCPTADRLVIRTGDHHIFDLVSLTDPSASGAWYQDAAVAIEPATDVELTRLPPRLSPAVKALSRAGEGTDELMVEEAHGVWAVRSASPTTVYYVDGDVRAVLRRAGPGSSTGPGDDRWVPLLRVRVRVRVRVSFQ